MTKKLDPVICEFETQEQADSYDKWFRAKVQHSRANPGKMTPHSEVMDHMKRVIAAAGARRKAESKCWMSNGPTAPFEIQIIYSTT